MPPKARGGTARKGKGIGKGAVKSKSILSFFSAPPAAAGSSHQQSPAPSPTSPERPLKGNVPKASGPGGLVDLTDDSGDRSSCSSRDQGAPSGAGGAISSEPAPLELKRDSLDPVAGGCTEAAGNRTGTGSSGKIGSVFGGAGSTAARQGPQGGRRTGFVPASSLISGTGRPTTPVSSGESTSMAPPQTPPTADGTPRAPATIARSTPPVVSLPSASKPSSTSISSSWGSLGRRPQQHSLSSNSHNKPIALPLHVVGLQFRENNAWSPPTPTESSPPLPPPADEHYDSIGSNRTLQLEREPYNDHDANAIKVLLPPLSPPSSRPLAPARFLGYIPGRIAVLLAPVLDASPGAVAQVTLKTVEEEGAAAGQAAGGGARNTLPALLEVQPLAGAGREPFSGLMAKLREAVKKEDKRQQKRKAEAKANQERLRSKQKTLLLDFGRSSSDSASGHGGSGGGSSASSSGSAQGGAMLESMPWEVLWQIFCSPGISSRELFGPIRSVCGNWMRAVDAMPCAAARRDVARVCAGEPVNARQKREGVPGDQKEERGRGKGSLRSHGEEADGTGNNDDDDDHDATVTASQRTSGRGKGKSHSNGRKRAWCWWDVVRARLVRGGGFTECTAKDVLQRLEWAAEHEEEDEDDVDDGGVFANQGQRGGSAASAVAVPTSDDDDDAGAVREESNSEMGGEGSGNGDDGIPCGGGKRRRMLRHLRATKALCEEWGIPDGAASASSSGAGTAPSCRASCTSGSVGGWSGWEAFGLAVATSASRDRLSLCCGAVRPLMGGDTKDNHHNSRVKGGQHHCRGPSCPGLPRGEVIELLCLMLCALRSAEGGGAGGGAVRLQADLLVCARVLENWDVRFQKAGHPGGGSGISNSGGGGASGLIANLTAEQRSIVLADVKAGGVLTVLAFAGTGKTTCLRAYAQARPHLKILYLTFNVSVREEAEKTFPPHVACKGVHQLAFRFVGRRFQSKLTQDLRESDVQAFLKDRLGSEKKISLATAARVLSSLNAFFSSDSPALSLSHVQAPPPDVLFQQQMQQQQQQQQQRRQQQLDGHGSDDGGGEVDECGEDSNIDTDTDSDDNDPSNGGRNGGRLGGKASNNPSPPSVTATSTPSLSSPTGGAAAATPGNAPPKKKRSRRDATPVEDATLLEWVAMAWAEMQSTAGPRGYTGGGYGGDTAAVATPPATLGMTHAGYLKLFQLSRPCLGRTYDVIMLDEAQDSNPCIASIVLRETACARILVGDSHQAIYGFIGAEDHLKRVEGGKVRHLTQVFRFDQSIAHVANSLVGPLKGETRPLLGNAGKKGKVILADGTGLGVWQEQGCIVKRPMAFLARTVAALVHAATRARSRGEKVAWVGGAQAYNLDAIEDMCLMATGRSEEVKHPLLKKLKTTKRLVRFIQESGDRQWASRLRMLDGKDANDLLAELRELQRKQVHPREADTILSTVHKAKGLEFDTVVLADDFIELDDISWTNDRNHPRPIWGSAGEMEEVNILYVAVTRAKRRLVANSSLRAFLATTGAWNSVCLRGVAAGAPGVPSSSSDNDNDNCAVCGRKADMGAGGCRLERLSKATACPVEEQGLRAAGGRGFSSAGRGKASDNKGGLLYAESGSLRPLCCWCVEGGGHAEGGGSAPAGLAAIAVDFGVDGDGQVVAEFLVRGGFSSTSRFPYAKALMRGLQLPHREGVDEPSG